jgi:hypothetical protein
LIVAASLFKIGGDRTFELIGFLILFFVLVSVLTLALVLIFRHRNRRETLSVGKRLETILRHLGRNLFGDDAWVVVEQTLGGNQVKIDGFLSLLDRESFDLWADTALRLGEVSPTEIEQLRGKLTYSVEERRNRTPALITECNPVLGMPVAVQQGATQTRGAVADIDKKTFALWVLGENLHFDESQEASFVLLSRSGTFQFDSHFGLLPDGLMIVDMPARSMRSQRRRFDRFPARLPVNVARISEDSEPIEATITELSGGGATVTDHSGLFGAGQVLNLSFEAGKNLYSVIGRVIRSDDGALHIRFEAMPDQERLEIAQAVVVLAPAHVS